MSDKNKPTKSKKDELQTYLSIAIVFIIVGVALIIPENTRMTGLPFIIIGITFFVLSQDESVNKRKK